jgi:hypothetical protein
MGLALVLLLVLAVYRAWFGHYDVLMSLAIAALAYVAAPWAQSKADRVPMSFLTNVTQVLGGFLTNMTQGS